MTFPWRLGSGLSVVFEDDCLLVVDKPAGLLSIAKEGGRDKSVYSILYAYLQKKGEKRHPAMVHRLDRETSGLLVAVKSGELKKLFMEHWTDQVVTREYAARVEGTLPGEAGVIDAALGENSVGRVFVVPPGTAGGKPAVTRWRVTARGRGWTGVTATLDTGRHNQIRVHFAHIGHPVVGDRKYGHANGERLFLHAETLALRHPRTGRVLEFSSPVPWVQQRRSR